VIRQPVIRQPVIRQPVIRQPVIRQPVIRQPVIRLAFTPTVCPLAGQSTKTAAAVTTGAQQIRALNRFTIARIKLMPRVVRSLYGIMSVSMNAAMPGLMKAMKTLNGPTNKLRISAQRPMVPIFLGVHINATNKTFLYRKEVEFGYKVWC
jgi:hypothetical protein